MKAGWLVGMLGLAMAVPGVGAGPTVEVPAATATEWLVASGLVEQEVVEQATVDRFTVLVPADGAVRLDPLTNALEGVSLPTALPPVPSRRVGCSGYGRSFGPMSEPPLAETVLGECPFKTYQVPPHSSYLACDAGDIGATSCFLVAFNFRFNNVGLYGVSCAPQGPVSGAALTWQGGGPSITTLNCSVFSFGVAPANWNDWSAFCGGFAALGTWSCLSLLP